MPTYPKKLHAAMMAVAVPVSSLLIAHHSVLSTILVNKEKSYKIYPALPIIFVYLINCKCCIKKDPTLPCQYIGQTCCTIRECFGEHRRGIENNIDESVPIYFNQPKHTLNDVQVIPLLHVNSNRGSIRFSMEQHLIDKAGTLQNSINRTCDH